MEGSWRIFVDDCYFFILDNMGSKVARLPEPGIKPPIPLVDLIPTQETHCWATVHILHYVPI